MQVPCHYQGGLTARIGMGFKYPSLVSLIHLKVSLSGCHLYTFELVNYLEEI